MNFFAVAPSAPAIFRGLQVIEFLRKRWWRKGCACLKGWAGCLYEISERRVRNEPRTLSDGQGSCSPLMAGAKGNINTSRF
jgi:hypothetical protein